MELSLEKGHVSIVFDTSEAANLSSSASWIEHNKTDLKSKITTDEYINNMENWEEGIYIFELGKSNSLNVPQKLK
jgi:hypothetical protein